MRNYHLFFVGLLITLLFSSGIVQAYDSPGKINYQAIVRNNSNELLKNSLVGVRFSILKGVTTKEVVYAENHQVLTDGNGLMSLVIGTGSIERGTALSDVDWSTDDYLLKVEIDPTGSSNYTITGITQLMSVPYSLHAKTASSLSQAIQYEDLQNKPALFSGQYEDLLNLPTFNFKDSIGKYGFDGSYDQLKNLPIVTYRDTISKYGFDGSYNSLTDTPATSLKDSITKYGFSGDYEKLDNKPRGDESGDLLYWNKSSENWNVLPKGEEGQFLAISDGALAWIDPIFANTNESTYSVGDIYMENGKPEGIVFEISTTGRYSKIISLKEYAKVCWDPKGTEAIYNLQDETKFPLETSCTDKNNGKNNQDMIMQLTNWSDDYPAFKAAAFEENWYLPSLNELLLIASQKKNINVKLDSLKEQRLDGKLYWTSTETGNFFAQSCVMNDYSISIPNAEDPQAPADEVSYFNGDYFESMKGDSLVVRPIKKLTWTQTTSKPKDETKVYKLGEIVYENLMPIGIVYNIEMGGQHGKMVSLDPVEDQWSTENVLTLANNLKSGLANLDSIKRIDVTLEKYPIFKSVMGKGNGWFIPSVEEFEDLNEKIIGLNALLPDTKKFVFGSYWTSYEDESEDNSKAQSIKLTGATLNSEDYKESSKSEKLKVLYIKQF